MQNVALLHALPSTHGPPYARHLAQLFAELATSSRALSVRIHDFPIGPEDDLERVFAEMKRTADVVLVDSSPFMWNQLPERVAVLALRHRLPTMHDSVRWAETGALVSYGPDWFTIWRRVAHLVSRTLSGEKPADIPVERPRNFELIFNLKTAKALNLAIPKHLLLLADRVIE